MNQSKNKSTSLGRHSSSAPQGAGEAWVQSSPWSRTLRETIESIAIAFMLAFLFRTFEAEAFVIPTGSMAPTLMGKHLDIACPMCGYEYRVGAPPNEEEDSTSGKPPAENPELAHNCVCPNCGYTLDFKDMKQADRDKYIYYNGDRILVSKFAYDFSPPERWDVIVFKYPEDAKTNYIKRLVGLPGDIIRVRDGDIAVSHDDGKSFAYQPRSVGKLRSMLQMVFDDDHAFRPFVTKGWPAALQSEGTDGGAWTAVANNSTEEFGPTAFITTGKSPSGTPAEAWLRYSHYIANPSDWKAFKKGLPFDPPQPEPINDSNPYDSPFRGRQLGPDVPVDDLAVEFQVDVQQAQGKLAIELVKQGQPFRCLLDLADGSAEMVVPGTNQPTPRAATGGISQTGSHRILFANVDHQLTLLVDNKKVAFDPPAVWSDVPAGTAPIGKPAAIGSIGAALQVNHVRVMRDIFYTWDEQRDRTGFPDNSNPPAGWPTEARSWVCYPLDCVDRLRAAKADVRPMDQFFFLGKDQFLTFGDNSRLSQDGRFWPRIHFVDRRLLIGKALVIYWPHSFDKVTLFGHDIPLPFWPNVSRMGFVK